MHILVHTDDAKLKNEIEQAVRARFNSTERYEVIDDIGPADLRLSVICMVVKNEANYRSGVVCTSHVEYLPYAGSSWLSTDMANAEKMVASSLDNFAYAVNGIADEFINGTTDSSLEMMKTVVHAGIMKYCKEHSADCAVPTTAPKK